MKRFFFLSIGLIFLLTDIYSQKNPINFRVINGKLYSQVFMETIDVVGYDVSFQASKKVDGFSFGLIGGVNWFEEFAYFPLGISVEYEFLKGKTLPTLEVMARYSISNDSDLNCGMNLGCNIGVKRSYRGKREKLYYFGVKTGIETQYMDFINATHDWYVYLPIKVHFDF